MADHRLTLIEVRVLMALFSYRGKNTNLVWPSRTQLSARCGYAEGTISNATKSLISKGWLRKSKQVFNGPNTYEITVPEPHRSDEVHRSSDVHRSSEHEPHRSGEHIPHRSGEPNRPRTDHRTEERPKEPSASSGPPPCPHQKIIDLYHEHLPEARRVREWTKQRERNLQARWREKPDRQNLEWWEKFFQYIRRSDFLMGRTDKPFRCDLEWIVKSANFVKILEGKYHS